MNLKCYFKKIHDFIKYDIPYGIGNLQDWFTVIWNDRHYDHYFILAILRHKLHLTEQLIRHHGHHTRHKEDANNIKLCIMLLDRLMKDEYHEMVFKRHDQIWGEPEMSFNDSKDHPGMSILNINRKNVKTPEDEKQELKSFRRASEAAETLHKQDINLLFDTMKKHIREWWD